MATSPSPSPLANLMARRANVQKARDAIGLSSGGAPNGTLRAGKPIGPNEPGTPTPAQPAVTSPQPADTGTGTPAPQGMHPDNIPQMSGNNRDEQLALVSQMLKQAANQGVPVASAPATVTAPPSTPDTVTNQIAAVGAQQMSPEAQFMRVAGRTPSAREMSMFYATTALAQQLGRNPTKNELLTYMTRPADNTPAPGPVVTPGA